MNSTRFIIISFLGFAGLLFSCTDDSRLEEYRDLIVSTEVDLNPTSVAPLSAIVHVVSNESVDISLSIGEEYPLKYSSLSDTLHSVIIHGLLAGIENEIDVMATAADGSRDTTTVKITTAPLPEIFPEIIVQKSSDDHFYFIEAGLCQDETSIGYPMIFDLAGNVRWYLNLTEFGIVTLPMTRLSNGNFITSIQDSLFELSLLGELVNTYKLPNHSVHHDIQETSDGNFIILTSKTGVRTIEDFMIEYDPNSRSIVKEWDFGRILDVNRHDISMNDFDWLHANSVQYVEERDVFVVSARHQGIFEMSYDGNLNWVLSPHKNWGRAGRDQLGEDLDDKLLVAVNEAGEPYRFAIQEGLEADDKFDWSWAQHGAVMSDNRLYCFDNGWLRQFEETGVTEGIGRGVMYDINTDDMTVRQIWDYSGTGNELYSFAMGDIDILSDDEALVLSSLSATSLGAGARILEMNTNTNQINTDIIVKYKNQNCIPGIIFGSFDFVYQGGRIEL